MQVSKWGNDLAVRLPSWSSTSNLKEGDEIEIRVANTWSGVSRNQTRSKALARLRKLRRPLPAALSFDREEANAR